jgi:hypothetical protein
MPKRETAKLVKAARVRPRFWEIIDNAIALGKKEGFVDLTELNAPRLPADFPKRIRDRRPEKVDPL